MLFIVKKQLNFMKKTTFLIVGKHAIIEALKNPNRKIERVFLTEDAQKNLNRENQSLNLLKNTHVFYKSRKELDNLCGKDEIAHQGLIAEAEQLEEITIKEFVLSLISTTELTITPLLFKEIAVSYAESLFVNKDTFCPHFTP